MRELLPEELERIHEAVATQSRRANDSRQSWVDEQKPPKEKVFEGMQPIRAEIRRSPGSADRSKVGVGQAEVMQGSIREGRPADRSVLSREERKRRERDEGLFWKPETA